MLTAYTERVFTARSEDSSWLAADEIPASLHKLFEYAERTYYQFALGPYRALQFYLAPAPGQVRVRRTVTGSAAQENLQQRRQ